MDELVKHKNQKSLKAFNKNHTKLSWNTHSWMLFWSSSKTGPPKSLTIKYVIHSRSDNFSIPLSDVSTGTPKLCANDNVSGSSATAPIKHIRFFDDTSGMERKRKLIGKYKT